MYYSFFRADAQSYRAQFFWKWIKRAIPIDLQLGCAVEVVRHPLVFHGRGRVLAIGAP